MIGDFVFSTRWQAARKLDDARMRWRHVGSYCLAFLPVAFWACWAHGWKAAPFLPLLAVTHFVIDSHRFRSTLGDRIGWMFASDHERVEECKVIVGVEPMIPPKPIYRRVTLESAHKLALPPNPWGPIPLLIDQSLHLVQLVVLGWLLT